MDEDLRIRKTRKSLRESIIYLLKKQQFEKINVTEICNQALVNRMTFYKYYEDKYHLLNDALLDIKDQISSKLTIEAPSTIDELHSFCTELISIIIDECLDNLDLLEALSIQKSTELLKIITSTIDTYLLDLIKEIDKIRKFKYPLPFVSSFIYGGFLQTFNYWLMHKDLYTKEQFMNSADNIIDELINSNILFKK